MLFTIDLVFFYNTVLNTICISNLKTIDTLSMNFNGVEYSFLCFLQIKVNIHFLLNNNELINIVLLVAK